MSYSDIIEMPVYELQQYIDWKIKFDKDRQQAENEAMEKMHK